MVTPIDNPFSSAQSTGDASRSSMAGTSDPLARSAQQAAESLRSASAGTRRSMRERMDSLNAFTNRSLATSRTYVREHPLRSTAMAVAAGMLLRRMMSRGRTHY